MKYLSFDPGNSTGWVYFDDYKGMLRGGTIVENFLELERLVYEKKPSLVIFERFALYPGLAQSLAWNEFYPCQVIGVINFLCEKKGIQTAVQNASIKKFSGGIPPEIWKYLKQWEGVTEHTKDAYLHLAYYLRVNKKALIQDLLIS